MSSAENQNSRNLTTADFRDAFRAHPAGVGVVTADVGAGPIAMTATSITSVSVEPPILAYSVSDQSSSAVALNTAETIVVHLLDSRDQSLAELCATSGSDRFGDTTTWSRLPTGEPYFHNVKSLMRCAVVERVRAGTGTVTILRALEINDQALPHATSPRAVDIADGQPLVYHSGSWHGLNDGSKIL